MDACNTRERRGEGWGGRSNCNHHLKRSQGVRRVSCHGVGATRETIEKNGKAVGLLNWFYKSNLQPANGRGEENERLGRH